MKAALGLLLLLIYPILAEAEDLSTQVGRIDDLVRATEYKKALVEGTRIAGEAKVAHNDKVLAEAYFGISDAHYYLGNRTELKHYAEEALKTYLKINDARGIARSYYQLSYYYERNQPEEMIHLLDQAKKFADKSGSPSVQAVVENAYGMALQDLGQYRLAASHYETSAKISSDEKDEHKLAIELSNAGVSYAFLGEYTKALQYFDRSLSISKQNKDRRALAIVLGAQGEAFLTLGNTDRALSCFEQSLALHEESGYKKGQLRQLLNITDVYNQLDDMAAIRNNSEKVLALANDIGDDLDSIVTMLQLSERLISDDQLLDAESYLQRAEALGLKIHNPILLQQIKLAQSRLEIHRKSLDAAQKDVNKAFSYSNQVEDPYSQAFAWSRQAEIYQATNKIPDAIASFLRAVSLHETTHTVRNLPEWYRSIAQLNADLGNHRAAEEYFNKSLSSVNKLDSLLVMDRFRVNLFREVMHIYHGYASWLAERGEVQRAWAIEEEGRARVLKLHMAQAMDATTLSSEERDWLGQLTSLQRKLREEKLTREERDRLLTRISTAEARYEEAHYQMSQNSAAQPVNDQISFPDSKHIVVEFALYQNDLMIFSRVNGATHFRRISPAEPVLQKAREFQQQASNLRPKLQDHSLARELYRALLQPELAHQESTRLILVPDDVLWSLPFAALADADNAYLAEHYALSVVPSVETLMRLQGRKDSTSSNVVVFANTTFPDTQNSPIPLPPLPGVEREAHMLQSRIRKSTIFMNQSESKVKQTDFSRYAIAHFATHTLVDAVHPERSCIATGEDSLEDGYLQVREIYRMKIPSEMIVLAGCRSGGGATVAGEGLMGLSHAFFAAGARTLVSTLWEVSDEGTLEFMKAFYGALEDHTIAEALQSAQVTMMHSRKWNLPGYWAGYVVMGDADESLHVEWSSQNLAYWIASGVAVVLAFATLLRRKRAAIRI